jgi:hypothetical protein
MRVVIRLFSWSFNPNVFFINLYDKKRGLSERNKHLKQILFLAIEVSHSAMNQMGFEL